MPELTLSVVDQSPLRVGGTAAEALRESVSLAQATEALGYQRYWVTEHHNSASVAGTAPEILIGQIASHTSTMRVGSAGVMLSHYSALKVAETFRILAAFYPGRIDLGIGRAPGSDQRTAAALAYPKLMSDVQLFPRQVTDLLALLADATPEEHHMSGIRSQPGPLPDGLPEVLAVRIEPVQCTAGGSPRLALRLRRFFRLRRRPGAGSHGSVSAAIPTIDLPEPAEVQRHGPGGVCGHRRASALRRLQQEGAGGAHADRRSPAGAGTSGRGFQVGDPS